MNFSNRRHRGHCSHGDWTPAVASRWPWIRPRVLLAVAVALVVAGSLTGASAVQGQRQYVSAEPFLAIEIIAFFAVVILVGAGFVRLYRR